MKKVAIWSLVCAMCLTLAACGSKGGNSSIADVSVDLTAFGQSVLPKYFDTHIMQVDPNEEANKTLIDMQFEGLSSIELEQCVIYLNNFSMVNSELLLVQVKETSDVDKVEEIFNARIKYMVGDGNGPGGAWYPGPTEIWENSSRVVTHGNYVMMVVGEQCNDVVAAFNEQF